MRLLKLLLHACLTCVAGITMLFLGGVSLSAQIKPSRTWFVDMARRVSPAGAMPSMMGGAEIFRGWDSFEHEQAWQLRLHAVAEPFRFTEAPSSDTSIAWTTSIEFHHELTANPLNNIGFNPRTARWEEQLLVHAATSSWSARAGWFHRCKHDIDNTDPPNEDTLAAYSPIRRTLILSGPSLGLTYPRQPDKFLSGSAGIEWFVINEDYRSPANSVVGSWRGMQGAIWLRMDVSLKLSESLSFGQLMYLSIPWFTSRFGLQGKDDRYEARAELFLTVKSTSSAMDVVLGVERLIDEVAFLSPTRSKYFQFGLRFRSL